MLDFSPVVARLKAQCPLFKEIAPATDRADAIDRVGVMPALYLLDATESGAPNRTSTGVHQQQITETFDLIYVINVLGAVGKGNARSRKATSVRKPFNDQVWSALMGWSWDASVAPLSFVSGQLIVLEASRLIFSQRFETSSTYRVERSNIYS